MDGAMDGAGRVGYEYHHRLRMDDDMILKSHEYILLPGVKNIIYQIRTNFIIKKKNNKNQATTIDDDEIIDSEQLMIVRMQEDWKLYDALYLLCYNMDRLLDYWMSIDEMLRLCQDAFDFGKQMASSLAHPQPSDLIMIPIVVDLDVCMVQLEGEAIEATRQRAITSKNLVPLYLWPCRFMREKDTKPQMLMSFLSTLKKIRVVNIEEGLQLMNVCLICSKSPNFGAQISHLDCGHAFHSHCVVGFLEKDNLCPSCRSPAYDPDYLLI